MPGYDLSKSVRNSLLPEYKCVSCKRLLRDAMQTSCGHLYCLSCLDNLVVTDTPAIKCLADQTLLTLEEVFPDNFMRKEIMQLVVQCTYVELGCKWKGEVRHLEMHTKSCEFLQVPCIHSECGMLVKKSDLKEHLEMECKCRLHKCNYCKKEVKLNLMQIHHNNDCPAYPTVCPMCNKDGVPRAKMTEHQDPQSGDCDGVQRRCLFSGCYERQVLTQNELQRHISLLLERALDLSRDVEPFVLRNPSFMDGYESVISGILALVQSIVEAENRQLREEIRRQDERITALERLVRNGYRPNEMRYEYAGQVLGALELIPKESPSYNALARRMTVQEDRTADQEVRLQENNRTVDDLRQKVSSKRGELEAAQEKIRQLERKVECQEHALAERDVRFVCLANIARQQQMSSNDGAILWKIDDYARKKNDAVSGRQTSFYSPCFYTSHHGYKMCARIYLNGDGMGKGTHISVFFVVMRGQFDALQRWPFRQKVTIMLLDQDNVEHVIDAFRPDPNSSSFQRPRREMNVASGCPLFCALSELNKHAYVRDDVMFLKIIVDTSDL